MSARFSLSLLVLAAWACVATADPPAGPPRPCGLRQWPWTRACPSVGCCPDDYTGKPCPNILPVCRCGGPDDYCRKPLPVIPCVPRCGGPDDYCRKALPTLLCPPASPYLRCGPCDPCATSPGNPPAPR